MSDTPSIAVVDPLTEREREELDAMLAELLLPDFSPRERYIARKAARRAFKLSKPAQMCRTCQFAGRSESALHEARATSAETWTMFNAFHVCERFKTRMPWELADCSGWQAKDAALLPADPAKET